MYIVRNDEIKKAVTELWKQYLLSITAGDIMLGEVADQLYVSDLDYECLMKSGKKKLLTAMMDIGFVDSIDDAIENLYEEPEDMKPFSELTQYMDPEEAYDALYRYIMGHMKHYDAKEVTQNPYYIHVKAPTAEKGDITLTMTDYLAGEFFQTYHKGFNRKDPF